MAGTFSTKMLFSVIAKFFKGGSDVIPEATKTVPLKIADKVAPVLTNVPALPGTSFIDLNGLLHEQMPMHQITYTANFASPLTKWIEPIIPMDILYPLLLCLAAGIIGLLLGSWLSATLYDIGYQHLMDQIGIYQKLVAKASDDYDDLSDRHSTRVQLMLRELKRLHCLIDTGTSFVSNLTTAYATLKQQYCAYSLWAEEQMEDKAYDQAVTMSAVSHYSDELQCSHNQFYTLISAFHHLNTANDKLREIFHAYVTYTEEQLAANRYDQAIIVSALSMYCDRAGDLGKQNRDLMASRKAQEVSSQAEIRALRIALLAMQREADALKATQEFLTKNNQSITGLNNKYLRIMDEQGKEIEACKQRVRDLEAAQETRPSIFKFDDDGSLQKRGQDGRSDIVKDFGSVSTNHKAHDANDKPNKGQSGDKTAEQSNLDAVHETIRRLEEEQSSKGTKASTGDSEGAQQEPGPNAKKNKRRNNRRRGEAAREKRAERKGCEKKDDEEDKEERVDK